MDPTIAITSELYGMLQKASGLYMLNLPTGASKTYSMYQAIARYLCTDGTNRRPILFVTPQKKNLKRADQEKLYLKAFKGSHQEGEAAFAADFLFLDNKRAYLEQCLMGVGKKAKALQDALPGSIQNSAAYKNLISALKACRYWERRPPLPSDTPIMRRMNAETEAQLQQALTKSERAFRQLVRRTAFQILSGVPDDKMHEYNKGRQGQFLCSHMQELAEHCPWAVELYPGTLASTKRLIFLSFDKFLSGNVSLIPGMADFMDLFDGMKPIVIIDEVDSTHKIWEQHILETALSNTNDLIRVFCTIHDHLGKKKDIPRSIRTLGKREGRRKQEYENDIDYLFDAADKIYKKYHLNLQLKYEQQENACLFGTSYYYTIGKAYSYLEYSKEHNAMLIHVEDHDAYQAYKKRYKGREDECLYPTSMIRQLRWFFQTFQTYLQKWAEDFAKDINAINTAKYLKEREEAADPRNVYHARSYTVQDAMSSILDTLGISYQDKRTQQMICEAGFRPDHAKKPADSWEAFLDAEMRLYRYFVSGYSLTEFENRDDHRERTELTYFSKPRTSEYRLLELAKETMVIGLSATARLPSLSNYYLPFLQEELGDKFYPMSDGLRCTLQKFYREMEQSYQEQHVSIQANALLLDSKKLVSQGTLSKALQKLYHEPAHAEAVAKSIWDMSFDAAQKQPHKKRGNQEIIDPSYFLDRYYEITVSVARFFQSEHSHAWLFLNYPLPDSKSSFSKSVIEKMIDAFKEEHPQRKVAFRVLRSKGDDGQSFEESLEEVKKILKEGTDLLLFSSYQSIGTGINLDYESSFYAEDFVDIYPDDLNRHNDPRHHRRDFDGFVLGEITYLLSNVADYLQAREERDFQKTEIQRHQMISDVMTLEEIDQIGYYESRKAIRAILSSAPSDMRLRTLFSSFKKCPYVAGQVQYLLTQALGRGNRSFIKNRHIQICCHARNLENLYRVKLNGWHDDDIYTPEWKSLCKLADDVHAPACQREYLKAQKRQEQQVKEQQIRSAENMCYREEIIFRAILGKAFHPDMVWTDAVREAFELLTLLVMCHPTFDSFDELLDMPGLTEEQLHRLQRYAKRGYLTFCEPVDSYHYVRLHDHRRVFPYLHGTLQQVLQKHGLDKYPRSDFHVGEVSVDQVNLDTLFDNLPGLRAYFEEHGYATTFRPARYIMTPTLFLNIYKGRLGEIVGSWILKKYGGLSLSAIYDLKHYEKFDRELPSGDFIDFKHWKFITGLYFTNRDKFYNKVYEKLESIRQMYPNKAAHAYIIRLCQTDDEDDELLTYDKEASFTYDDTHRIMTVPALLMPDGVNMKAINEICKNELLLRQERGDAE